MPARRKPLVSHNVPKSADALLNPALTRQSLLGRLIESWAAIFVLCYGETCAVHRPEGAADGRRMWWPSVQQRITVFDAAKLDIDNREVLKWAGCNQPGRPASHSSQPANRAEPCVFARGAGGSDWRRTAQHRLAALLAHLVLVETAAKLKLSSVLILEADLVPSQAVAQLSASRNRTARLAQQLRRAFATKPWSVARISGMFYSKEYAVMGPRRRLGCSRQCRCTRWEGSELVESVSAGVRLCEVAPAARPSDQILPMVANLHSWCDVRDTAAYAVHRSAFGAFVAYLDRLRALPRWLRRGADGVPAIDNWLPYALPNVYVLPTLVTQPTTANDSQGTTGLLRQKSAVQFMHVCADRSHMPGKPIALLGTAAPAVPMKLSTFATRHLYVMKDRMLERHYQPRSTTHDKRT